MSWYRAAARFSREVSPRALAGLMIVSMSLLVAGCPLDGLINFPPGNTDPNDTSKNASTLRRFESPEELRDYLTESVRREVQDRNIFVPFSFGVATADLATEAGGEAAPSAADDVDSSGSFTGTNLQETGVDESDVIKTDGQRLFVARSRTVRIVDLVGDDAPTELSSTDFDARIDEMYLTGDTLIVLATRFREYEGPDGGYGRPEILIWPPFYQHVESVLFRLDVTDSSAPQIVEEVTLDGTLAASRLIDGRLYLVLTIVPEITEEDASTINPPAVDELLPAVTQAGASRPLVDWDACWRPDVYGGTNMTAVVSLNADNLSEELDSVAVVADAGVVYASQEALYITDTDYTSESSFRPMTTIHKFTFGDDGLVNYAATGVVPGRPLNPFSLSEYEGDLRVATHVWPELLPIDIAPRGDAVSITINPPEQDTNAIYVLSQDGDQLTAVGAIEDIAPGEQIYSARFLGPRGFLVTFRQIDPLFTVDLSDPTNPQLLGELELPGFSNYLHPVGEDLLIGVGEFVDPNTGWTGGVQLALFDVADFTNPALIERLVIGDAGSWTDVNQTHKAFAFLDSQNLLALPITEIEYSGPFFRYDAVFEGIRLFEVTAGGFNDRGELAVVETPYYGSWKRGVIANDELLAITSSGVRAAALSDLEATQDVVFTPSDAEADVFPGPWWWGDEGGSEDVAIAVDEAPGFAGEPAR